MTFEELIEMFNKIAISQAENAAQQKLTDEQLKKTDEQINKTAEQQKLTDEQINKTAEQQKLTDEQLKKTAEQLKKTDEKLKNLGIYVGNMADNNGITTEDYFYNSLYDNPTLGGIKYDTISKNIHSKTKRLEDEYDIVMYNGDSIALIECKYKAHENDIRRLIHKKVDNFRLLFPDYKDYSIYLGIASFSFYPELELYAKENGVAILKQKGDVVEIDADNLKSY